MAVLIKGQSIACNQKSRDHYLRGPENEKITILEVSGFATKDADEALQMIELLAKGTKCRKPLYSAKINPEPDRIWTRQEVRQAVEMLEKNLGLTGHPRVVIEHVKKGRVHYHVLWNRFHPDGGPARNMGNDYAIHRKTQREIEKSFKLKPMMSRGRDFKVWEVEWAKRYGYDIFKLRDQITKDFNGIKSGQAFIAALKAKGIILCRGDKSQFVIILPWGQHKALSSMIYGRPTKAVLRRAMADIDIRQLPTVQEGKERIKAILKGKDKRRPASKRSAYKRKRSSPAAAWQPYGFLTTFRWPGTKTKTATKKTGKYLTPIAKPTADLVKEVIIKAAREKKREREATKELTPTRPMSFGSMSKEQLADYIAACDGKITWAQYFQKWGHAGPHL